jgi:hypothetical protein
MQARVVVLVSAQAVIDNAAYRVLYGVQVADTDSGHVLAVSVILDGTPAWLDAAAGLMAVHGHHRCADQPGCSPGRSPRPLIRHASVTAPTRPCRRSAERMLAHQACARILA